MFAFRGRGGPSKSTPANVQCQKCLKRARHYSYECKASSQDRPYVSRPSRSQQLRNPKLMPKLTEATPTSSDSKKGIADQEIAKQEAERAKDVHAEDSDDEVDRSVEVRRRSRSVSSESVSTISTSGSRSPPPRSQDRSPEPQKHGHDARGRGPQAGRSHSPPRRRHRSYSRDSRSPPRRERGPYRARDDDVPPKHIHEGRSPKRERRYWSASEASGDSRPQSRDSERQRGGGQSRHGRGRGQQSVAAEPSRERSLSPFSRRMAMTREMKSGGR